jgi:hypothetical protein
MAKPRLQKVVDEFSKEMHRKGVPYYVTGIILDKNNPVIEIVVQRPERYNKPEVLSKIPKSYKSIKVIIV